MAETALLSFLAPSARPLAPQVTALPALAAYHDLRWLFLTTGAAAAWRMPQLQPACPS